MPYIGLDDFASMHRLTETVLKNRWDNIFYFSPAIEYPNAFAQRLRYEGFLNAAGNTEYTVLTNIENVCGTYEGKTVFICSTDYYAIQIYRKNRRKDVFTVDYFIVER